MSADTRLLFVEVEKLLRLLLVSPAISCEAERSFSALRRIKAWLRNSMTQVRLNAAAICNVHKDRLDKMGVKSIAADFAGLRLVYTRPASSVYTRPASTSQYLFH